MAYFSPLPSLLTPLKYLLVIIVHVEKYDYLCSGNYF